MRKIIAPLCLLIGLLLPALSLAQVNIANLPPNSFVGRLGIPSAGGPAQAVPFATFFANGCVTFGSGVPGCVPASGGGTVNFLRADATFADPCNALFNSTTHGCVPASGGGTTNFLRADGAFAPFVLTTAHFYVGNASNVATDLAMSGDCTLAVTGAVTCTKTNGVNFAPSATTDTTNAANITSGALPIGRMPSIGAGHVLANATGAPASAADTVASTWFDQAFCATAGQLITRISGTWICSVGSPVNVTWFGVATGNTPAANSTAISAAQAACTTCTYYFPAGAYKIANTIVLGNQQWLRCETSASTEINIATINTNVVQIGGANTNTAHQRITGCMFTASATQSGTQAITTQNAHNIFIDHIIICSGVCGAFGTQAFANGIYLGGKAGTGGDGFFQFVSEFYMTGVSGVGIIVGGSGGGSPAGVYLHHGTIYSSGTAGIFVAQTGGFSIDSVEATLSGTDGLLIAPGAGQSALYGFVTNSFFDTSTDDGIKIAPTGTGVVGMMSFSNSWAATSTNTGVGIIGGGTTVVEGITLSEMTIYNNKGGGFYQNGGTDTVAVGNKIMCNNQLNTTLDNVNFNNTIGVVLQGNYIGVTSTSLGTCFAASHDINFAAGNNYTLIVGNNTHGSATNVFTGAGANTVQASNL